MGFVPKPEEGCYCFRGFVDMQFTMIAYVDGLLVSCQEEAPKAGVIEALKAK